MPYFEKAEDGKTRMTEAGRAEFVKEHPEAGRLLDHRDEVAGRRARDLDGEIDTAVQRFREEHPGVEVVVHPGRSGGGSGASARPGRVELHLDDLRDDLSSFSPQDRAARMEGHFREERTHLLQFEAVKRTLPEGKDYETHFREYYEGLHAELAPEQLAAARSAYGASSRKGGGEVTHGGWDRLDKHQQAAETVRMFLEQRLAGTQNEFTRAMSKSLPERVKTLIRAAVDYLREQVQGGKVSKAVQKELDVLEGILREQQRDGVRPRETVPDAAMAGTEPVLHGAASREEFNKPIEDALAEAKERLKQIAPEEFERVGRLWDAVATRGDSHQLGKNLTAESLKELFEQLPEGMPEFKVEESSGSGDPNSGAWLIDHEGNQSRINAKGGQVDANTMGTKGDNSYWEPEKRDKDGMGPAIYQVTQSFAHNTGQKFVPQENVEPLAQFRRLVHMFSSALRHRSTKHLGGRGENPFEVGPWTDGENYYQDIGVLGMAIMEYTRARLGDFDRDLRISADGNSIVDADGHILGKDSGRTLESYLSGARHPKLTGVGQTTLRQALVTSQAKNGIPVALGLDDPSLLDADWQSVQQHPGGDGSPDLLREGGGGSGSKGGVVEGILYSAPSGEGGGAAGGALDRLPPIYQRVHLAAQGGEDEEEIAKKEGIRVKAVQNILRDTGRYLEKAGRKKSD